MLNTWFRRMLVKMIFFKFAHIKSKVKYTFFEQVQTETIVYKKSLLLLFITALLASCGVRKSTVSPVGKSSDVQQEILDYGMKYLNSPYRYAGRGPHSFDCSGFTSFVFKEFGYRLSASSAGQDKQVPKIENREDLRIGDLVFFEGRTHNGNVGHVGIVKDLLPRGEFTFLHASTSYGVIVSRSTEEYYASRYLRGGRVLDKNNRVVIAKNAKSESAVKEKEEQARRKNGNLQDDINQAKIVPPKTETEQQLAAAASQNPKLAEATNSSNDNIVIHSRPAYLPPVNSSSNSSNGNPETTPHISKDVRRSSNTNVPKPEENKDNEKFLSHEVKPGETLSSIARKYGSTVNRIKELNPQLGSILRAGEKLRVKEAGI